MTRHFFQIKFVKESEIALEHRQSGGRPGLDVRTLEPRIGGIISHFNSAWKSSLDSLNGEVLNSFPNFKNGTNILQQALTQFVQYYHRFFYVSERLKPGGREIAQVSGWGGRNLITWSTTIWINPKKYLEFTTLTQLNTNSAPNSVEIFVKLLVPIWKLLIVLKNSANLIF